MGEWYVQDVCIQTDPQHISGGTSQTCCAVEPLVSCHYKDKPSKVRCDDSPNIDQGRAPFWKWVAIGKYYFLDMYIILMTTPCVVWRYTLDSSSCAGSEVRRVQEYASAIIVYLSGVCTSFPNSSGIFRPTARRPALAPFFRALRAKHTPLFTKNERLFFSFIIFRSLSYKKRLCADRNKRQPWPVLPKSPRWVLESKFCFSIIYYLFMCVSCWFDGVGMILELWIARLPPPKLTDLAAPHTDGWRAVHQPAASSTVGVASSY
jgi:hypothetical protein